MMDALLKTINLLVSELQARGVFRAMVTGFGLVIGTDSFMAHYLEGVSPWQQAPFLAVGILCYALFEWFFSIRKDPFRIEPEPPFGEKEPESLSAWQQTSRWVFSGAACTVLIVVVVLGLHTRNVWLYHGRQLVVQPFTNQDGTGQLDGHDFALTLAEALSTSTVLEVVPGDGLPSAGFRASRESAQGFPIVLSGTIASDGAMGLTISVFLNDGGSRGLRTLFQDTVSTSDPEALIVAKQKIVREALRKTQGWTLAPKRIPPPRSSAERQYAIAYKHLEEGSDKHLNLSEQSLQLASHIDTTYVGARAALATTYALMGYRQSDSTSYLRADSIARQLIQGSGGRLHRDLAGAYTAKGIADLYFRNDLLEAGAALRQATQLDPRFLLAYQHLALAYLMERREEDAHRVIERAFAQDSTSIPIRLLKGQLHYFAAEFGSARAVLGGLIEQVPCTSFGAPLPAIESAYTFLARSYLMEGRDREARRLLRERMASCIGPPSSFFPGTGEHGPVDCSLLREPEFEARLATAWAVNRATVARGDSLIACVKDGYKSDPPSFEIARYHALRGGRNQVDSVLVWSRKARQALDPNVMFLEADPAFALVLSAGRDRSAIRQVFARSSAGTN
jgi:tetratricopeptide (TPR) repeat protein